MSTPDRNRRPRWATVALTVLPLWLIASAGVAVWLSIRNDRLSELEEQQRFVAEMSVERIADDLRKFTTIIGERNTSSPSTSASLMRTAAMIEGVLGPANTGYKVERLPGPTAAPVLRAIIRGQSPQASPIWVLTAYDSPRQSSGAALNASGNAAVIAAAQAMAADKLPAAIHFIFIPHGNDPNAPIAETLAIVSKLEPRPALVICPDAMGASGPLMAAADGSPALKALSGLGITASIAEAETPWFKAIRESGMSAVRATTQLQPGAAAGATAEHVATSAGRLVEWLRRCARLAQQP